MQPALRDAILYGARWYEKYEIFGMATLTYADIGELKQAWKCLRQLVGWRRKAEILSKIRMPRA